MDGIGGVAIVVPLEESDVVLGYQCGDPIKQVSERVGMAQVEYLLAARRWRHPARCAEHPIGVGAGHVGVEVHHLGFEPQAEVHPNGADVRGDRAEPLGPHRAGHVPVAQARTVVSSTAEPAVVDHEALDADLGGDVGQLRQPAVGMVEVDGLPGVEHDRPGLARMVRPAAQHRVQPRRGTVEATVGPHAVDPRRRHRLARCEHDLAGAEDLTGTQQRGARVESLGQVALIARPAEVNAPDLSAAISDAGRADGEQQRRVRAGAPTSLLTQPGALAEWAALSLRLVAPPAGMVEHLDHVLGHR